MRSLLWFLALFALAAGIAVAGRFNDGYVLLVLPPNRVELSLNFFVVLFLLLLALAYMLSRLVVSALAMPARVREFRHRKLRDKAAQALRESLRALFEGRWGRAERLAAQAHSAGEAPGLAALIGARAAHGMRDAARERDWLGRAAESGSELRNARLMTQAELHLESRRFEEAQESLRLLQQGGQRQIAALRLGLRACQGAGDWDGVLRIARQLEKHKVLSAQQAAPVRARAHLENLRLRARDGAALAAYWSSMPAAERSDARLAAAAARAMIEAGDCASAQRVLEAQLDVEWNADLVELYGECREGDALARISRAEAWLQTRPQDAVLLLTLGRLCRTQRLWGKAQSYLEASIALQSSRQAHLELARLHDELDRAAQADRHYRAAADAAPARLAAEV